MRSALRFLCYILSILTGMEQTAVWHCSQEKEGQNLANFQEIYKEYGKSVYRFLLSLTREEGLAEELLQETFYQAFLHIDQYEGRSSLYTWLCQIGKNAWLKECRRNKWFSEDSLDSLRLSATEPSPDEQFIQKEEMYLVRQAILKLEEPYKNVFILHAYGGVKLKEIAQIYKKSESWARVTYYRARQQIVKEVSK